jgi:hypothetical protein
MSELAITDVESEAIARLITQGRLYRIHTDLPQQFWTLRLNSAMRWRSYHMRKRARWPGRSDRTGQAVTLRMCKENSGVLALH